MNSTVLVVTYSSAGLNHSMLLYTVQELKCNLNANKIM